MFNILITHKTKKFVGGSTCLNSLPISQTHSFCQLYVGHVFIFQMGSFRLMSNSWKVAEWSLPNLSRSFSELGSRYTSNNYFAAHSFQAHSILPWRISSIFLINSFSYYERAFSFQVQANNLNQWVGMVRRYLVAIHFSDEYFLIRQVLVRL